MGLILALISRVVFFLKPPGPPHEAWPSLPLDMAMSGDLRGNPWFIPVNHQTMVRFREMKNLRLTEVLLVICWFCLPYIY